MKNTFFTFLCIAGLLSSINSFAQDTEFPEGFIAHIHLHSGLSTVPGSDLDLYVGGIQLVPQFTIVPSHLRAGIVAGGIYSARKINGLFGLTADIKLATISLSEDFGVNSNVFFSLQHLWGTDDQKLIGGSIGLEALSLLQVKLNIHRDYHFDSWWVALSLGIRISKPKKDDEPFND